MKQRTTAVALLAMLALTSPAAAQPAQFQGQWRSADTTVRIAVSGSEAKGTFAEVGPAARQLGFKPGESSFVATIVDNYLHGSQTIRYGGNCHPNGRRVPIIGRITPNGQTLALHFYQITVDGNCRDTGQYTIGESLWQRVPGR